MPIKIFTHLKNYRLSELLIYAIERGFRIRLPLSATTRWRINLKSEVRFWDRWFKTRGLTWPEEYNRRLDPNLLLQNEVIELLPSRDPIKILDVGAGPLTALGKVFPGHGVNITAVDPLSDHYDRLLARYAITPLIRTGKLDAELLSTRFPENSFDLVFARNCIDHSYSPEIAILEMIKVVKTGCYILLLNRPDEAEKEDWRGLHQWNFSGDNDELIISSKNFCLNFSQKYKSLCQIRCLYLPEDDMLHIAVLKKDAKLGHLR